MHNTIGRATPDLDSSRHSLEDLSKQLDKDTTPGTSTPVENSSDHDSDKVPREVHGYKWALVCLGLYICCFIYGLDTTIVADIQAATVKSLGHVEQLTWVGTGFPLGSICVILPSGAAYSLFNMKWLLIGSIVLFEIGSAVCGAAPSMNALIVGRVIAGVGGSGMYIGILSYFTVCTSMKERGAYISGIGFVWGLGAILGPIVGGLFAESSATWRWAFYINLVVAAICAPIYIFYLPSVKSSDDNTVLQKLSKMDWTGIFLSAAVVCTLGVAFTFGGITWSWSDGKTITFIVLVGVFVVLLAIQQNFHLLTTADTRLFPPGYLLLSRTQLLLVLQTACSVTNVHIPVYYLPLYLQFVRGDGAIQAAVRLLPYMMFMISVNLFCGFMLPRVAFYWILYLATGIIMTTGGALLYTIDVNTPVANIYGYSIVLAVGVGLTIAAGFSIAAIKVSLNKGSAKDIGSAVAVQNLAQVGGVFLALLISGQVFQSYGFRNLKTVLQPEGFTDAQIRTALSGAQSGVLDGLSPELMELAINAIAQAIRRVFILSIVAGGFSLLGALGMKKERLFGAKPEVVAA